MTGAVDPSIALDPTAARVAAHELTAHREALLALARESIAVGVRGSELAVDPEQWPAPLRDPAAVFVTLHLRAELRGCVGTLEPREPLVAAVARYARRSAFDDRRFDPVTAAELEALEVSISVLRPPEPLDVRSYAELFAALRPGRDGLVIHEAACGATFLPAVWSQLPNPSDFVAALERKAGLVPGRWSRGRRCLRYAVIELA
jgi:AmmeMemoRadiSam system protein A